ncbi:MAG: hypothetical protein II956_08760 [Bacteroidales bacterium]|nr:hypothetical protein [Bacteroidales bacterium]
MKKKLLVFMMMAFAVLPFFSSCGSVKDCDYVATEFYDCLRESRYDDVFLLLDKDALQYTPKEIWLNGFKNKEKNFGAMLTAKRIGFESITQERVTRVGIKYKVIYANVDVFEKLEFVERGDGQYKITFYQYNTDSLLVD